MADKISFYTIQKRLKSIVELKNKMNGNEEFKSSSAYKNFELKFDNFNWDKYASALTEAKSLAESGDAVAKNTSIFSVLDKTNMSDDEKSLAQLLDVIVANEDVLKQLDSDMDSIITGDEMKTYFDGINSLDNDDSNLSLKDIAKFMSEKGISLEDDETKMQEAYTNYQNELMAEQAASGAGSSGGTGGTDSTPKGGDKTDDASKNPYVDKTDVSSMSGAETQQYVDTSVQNLSSLSGLSSSDLSKSLEDGSNAMASMSNMSKEDREKLQQAAQKKEEAASNVATAKEAIGDTESKVVDATEVYQTAVENQAAAQEALLGTQALVEAYTAQKDNLLASISALGESISSLEGQIQDVPSLSSDATSEERSNRAQIIASNNAIKAQIASLQREKASQEQQEQQVEAQLSDALTLQQTQTTALSDATTALETARSAVEELQNSEMTEAEKTYMDSVSAYDTACSEYNTVKAEVMANVNKEIKEEGQNAVEKRKTEDINVAVPVVDETTMKLTETVDELHKLANGEMKPEEATEENRALWEKYGQFTDEQKEQIAQIYGSEDEFFAFLSVIKATNGEMTDENGETISYTDVILNPENYAEIAKDLEQYKIESDDGASKYDTEKLTEVFMNMEPASSEDVCKYFAYLNISCGNSGGILGFMQYLYDSDASDEVYNAVNVLTNSKYAYSYVSEIIEKATQDAKKTFAAVKAESEPAQDESKSAQLAASASKNEGEVYEKWNGVADSCISYLKDCMEEAGIYLPDEVASKYSDELEQYFIENGAVVVDKDMTASEKEELISTVIKPGFIYSRGEGAHMGVIVKVNDDGSFVTRDGGGEITEHTRTFESDDGDFYIFDPEKLPEK